MASNRVTKIKATKKAVAKPTNKTTAKTTGETSRELLEERLEFVLTCIRETGIKIDWAAVSRHYDISANAAQRRLLRAKDCVAKLVRAGAAASKKDKTHETTEDEEV
ncbi:uncharacterized protein N7479_004035 [Penicillium vulpinum]|uniref:uncharacterized protein n=1 Tax=Penicillium vulpinum TaxID=29845 RepID=UPI002548B683|nr:uncharacterized protein N7479_004035 [Penicillium vulpinum]KAJ5964159.1 hypothetical protein N7479_004035 [Penicillium vulpinum]